MTLTENLTERFVDALIVTKNRLRDDHYFKNKGRGVSDPETVLATANTMLEVRRASFLKDNEEYADDEIALRKWIGELAYYWAFWRQEAISTMSRDRSTLE